MQAITQSAHVAEAVRAWFLRSSLQQFGAFEFAEDPSISELVCACHSDGTIELTVIHKDGSIEGGTL